MIQKIFRSYKMALSLFVMIFIVFSAAPSYSAQVFFNAAITASGEETTGFEQRTYGGHFPYFEIRGGLFCCRPSQTEIVTYCLPSEADLCTIDTSRTSGKGGPGYGISVTQINSPGGDAQESYVLNGRCLTSTVTVTALRRQRGWYEGDHQIYVNCPIRKPWSYTQTQGFFPLDNSSGYSFITSYTGPIGSPAALPGTASVYSNDNGYKVTLLNKNPANAIVTTGMFQSTPAQGNNGPRLYALYAANDVVARGLEVTQGIQNLQNDMPLVAGRRTYVRFYASADNPVSGINAQLRAFKNGVELNGSPINAESTIPVRNSGIDRTILDHAFLFKLPAAWTTSGAVEFRATVNPQGLSTDINSVNNTWSDSVNFQTPSRSANVVVGVPLKIHQDGDSDKPYFIYENSASTYLPIVSNLTRMHPIAATIPQDCGVKPLKPTLGLITWDVSSTKDWGRMLWRVSLERAFNSCGASGSYWQGMIHPGLNGRALNGIAYGNSGGLVGDVLNGTHKSSVIFMSGEMGANGRRWSMPLGATFGHELGHNKGLDHVCNIGSPEGVDESYPYTANCEMSRGENAFFANGHDGYFMMDVYHDFWGINEPAILGSNAANVSFPWNRQVNPMMSYTHFRWVSPYSYCKLLDQEGIRCNKQLISAHLPKLKDTKATAFVAKKNATRKLNSVHADLAPGSAPSPSFKRALPVASAVLPSRFRPSALSTSGAEYLLVSGIFDVTKPTLDVFTLMKLSELPSANALDLANQFQANLLSRNTQPFYDVLVLNQYDNLTKHRLLKTDIVADLTQTNSDGVSSEKYLLQFVEADKTATYFELTYGSRIVATATASNSAPSISVNAFTETTLSANSVIRWNASDADNDALTFSIYYRRNINMPWRLIDSDITGNTYRMLDNLPDSNTNPLSYYAGSDAGMFRVVAYDGFHTTAADSNAIAVPNNTPRVSIMQQDGLAIKLGQTLYLNGQASDVEDGTMPSIADTEARIATGILNSASQLQWTSSINGVLGQGPELSTRNLSRGKHLISLKATDSNGVTGTAKIVVFVGMENNLVSGNIAPQAVASASSSYCPSGSAGVHCYFPSRINDRSNSAVLGGDNSWTNEAGSQQWVQLQWSQKVVITASELYTSEGYPIQDYDLQYWNGVEWVNFVSVKGNVNLYNVHNLEDKIVTDKVRVLGLKGPSHQPQYFRVNELVINGYALAGKLLPGIPLE
jgi:hypothetical protein